MNSKLLALGLLSLALNPVFAATKKIKGKAKAESKTSDVLKIDATSSIVDWHASKVTGEHNGKVKVKEGSFDVSAGELKSGTVTIDMTSINNEDLTDAKYNEKLITHLKSDDFFSVEKNPTATFKINSVKVLKSDDHSYEVSGDLTIKGTTNPLTFPTKIEMKDGTLTATGTAKVDRTKYGIKYGSGKFFEGLGDKVIHDEFDLKFNLVAKK